MQIHFTYYAYEIHNALPQVGLLAEAGADVPQPGQQKGALANNYMVSNTAILFTFVFLHTSSILYFNILHLVSSKISLEHCQFCS